MAAAVDMTLPGRFYERFADHTVEVARPVHLPSDREASPRPIPAYSQLTVNWIGASAQSRRSANTETRLILRRGMFLVAVPCGAVPPSAKMANPRGGWHSMAPECAPALRCYARRRQSPRGGLKTSLMSLPWRQIAPGYGCRCGAAWARTRAR